MIRSFVLILVMLFYSCVRTAEPFDPQQLQRMEAVRERLKKELGEKYDQPIPAASTKQLNRGSELYAQLCASCHGARGDGKGEIAEGIIGHPSDFTDAKQAAFYSEQARLQIIRKGIPGTPMMGWENVLTEEEMLSVYVYVRSLILK
jgi:high-affinity iron transporter